VEHKSNTRRDCEEALNHPLGGRHPGYVRIYGPDSVSEDPNGEEHEERGWGIYGNAHQIP
jgi:hypothetical protein